MDRSKQWILFVIVFAFLLVGSVIGLHRIRKPFSTNVHIPREVGEFSRSRPTVHLQDCTPSWRLLQQTDSVVVVQSLPVPVETHTILVSYQQRLAHSYHVRVTEVVSNPLTLARGPIQVQRPETPPFSARDGKEVPTVASIDAILGPSATEPRILLLGPQDRVTFPLCAESNCILPVSDVMKTTIVRELVWQQSHRTLPAVTGLTLAEVERRLSIPGQTVTSLQDVLNLGSRALPLLTHLLQSRRFTSFNDMTIRDVSAPDGPHYRHYSVGDHHGGGWVARIANAFLQELTGDRCPCENNPNSEACISCWSVIVHKYFRVQEGQAPSECASN